MTVDERDNPVDAPAADPHDAAVDLLAKTAPPGASDEERPRTS